MKLWLLEARSGELPREDNPCAEWDVNLGYVIRAKTEERARQLAQDKSSHESDTLESCKTPWLDPHYTTCTELGVDGPEEVIMIEGAHG